MRQPIIQDRSNDQGDILEEDKHFEIHQVDDQNETKNLGINITKSQIGTLTNSEASDSMNENSKRLS